MDSSELHTGLTRPLPVTSSGVWRWIAQGISFIFHPLFIPFYVTFYLLFLHPAVFAGYAPLLKWQRLATVLLNLTFLPGFSVFLLWQLRFIPSPELKTRQDRIIPYAASLIFYFWAWYAMSKQAQAPVVFISFLQGCFFSVCAAWLFNIQSKVSMHATAVGGTIVFFLFLSFTEVQPSLIILALVFLVAGCILTARYLVSGHSHWEIFQGLFSGALAMAVAWLF